MIFFSSGYTNKRNAWKAETLLRFRESTVQCKRETLKEGVPIVSGCANCNARRACNTIRGLAKAFSPFARYFVRSLELDGNFVDAKRRSPSSRPFKAGQKRERRALVIQIHAHKRFLGGRRQTSVKVTVRRHWRHRRRAQLASGQILKVKNRPRSASNRLLSQPANKIGLVQENSRPTSCTSLSQTERAISSSYHIQLCERTNSRNKEDNSALVGTVYLRLNGFHWLVRLWL